MKRWGGREERNGEQEHVVNREKEKKKKQKKKLKDKVTGVMWKKERENWNRKIWRCKRGEKRRMERWGGDNDGEKRKKERKGKNIVRKRKTRRKREREREQPSGFSQQIWSLSSASFSFPTSLHYNQTSIISINQPGNTALLPDTFLSLSLYSSVSRP